MWPLLSGANTTSPRTLVFLGDSSGSQKAGNTTVQGVVRADGYKLLLGEVSGGFWQGPVYPNSTVYPNASKSCGDTGCLFNVLSDPNEHHECSAQLPAIAADLAAEIKRARGGVYSPDRGADDGVACSVAASNYGGFIGPFLAV